MRLYVDEKLVSQTPDADALEAALGRWLLGARGSVELRRSPEAFLRATRDEPGWYLLEVAQRGNVFGLRLDDGNLSQARAAFEEFFRGFTPRLPWKRLRLPKTVEHVILGDGAYRDDCPLCQMGR